MQNKTNQKTLILALFIVILKVSTVNAQAPEIWLRADDMGDEPGIWQDVSENGYPASCDTILNNDTLLNFNPAVNFETLKDSLVINYNAANKDYLKVFTVFRGQADTSGEQYVWRFGNKSMQSIQLSNKRLYNNSKVYKYTGGDISKPVINIVDKYNSNSESERSERIYLGSAFEDTVLSGFFKGDIAEILVFDQELTFEEHSSIESYLAIKYGVCLYSDYYNPDEEIIWSAEDNGDYTNNVFAIGKDKTYGLDQKQSQSAEGDILMVAASVIETDNQSNLSDMYEESYMFFSDNGADANEGLSIEQAEGSLYAATHRWKVNSTGKNMYRTELAIRVNTGEIFDSLPGSFCMIRDDNKDGQYEEVSSVYPDSISESGYAYFSELKFCSSGSDEDYFTFAITSPLEVETGYTAPACEEAYGSAIVELQGGTAPYSYELKDDEDKTIKEWVSLFEEETIDSLLPGEYTLNITDASGNRYTLETGEELSVQTPDLGLNTIYSYDGSAIELDMCSDASISVDSCTWFMEGEAISNNCLLSINEGGTYSVEISSGACLLSTQFYVTDNTGSDEDNTSSWSEQVEISTVKVAPNPTLGSFKVYINMKERSDVNLFVTDAQGSIIENSELKNIQYYIYNGELKIPGMYIITLVTGNEILYSKQLIIE